MMSSDGDGREDYLAPVTDLFSRRTPAEPAASAAPADAPRRGGDAVDEDGWWVDPDAPSSDDAAEGSEPNEVPSVIQLPGLIRASELQSNTTAVPVAAPSAVAPSAKQRPPRAPRLRAVSFEEAPEEDPEPTADELTAAGERVLLKKLVGKGLSVSESRTLLRGVNVPAERIDDIIDDFLSRGYLDDAVLAEQLVYTALTRKKQGRRAVAQTLGARGLDRETIDAALDELPDDDAERALEYARSKAHSLGKLDPDVALRRLMGQLARRGFPGNVAMNAAKTALAEVNTGRVRFR